MRSMGYATAYTAYQDEAAQGLALRDAGCSAVFCVKQSPAAPTMTWYPRALAKKMGSAGRGESVKLARERTLASIRFIAGRRLVIWEDVAGAMPQSRIDWP